MDTMPTFGLDPLNAGIPTGNNPFMPKQEKLLGNEPSNLTGRQLAGKIGLGLIIGGMISALLFIVISFVGGMFTSVLSQASGEFTKPNPLLPIILLFIGFLSSFIGNIAVAGSYNLFFNKKYYDGSKNMGILLLTNGLLFFILAPIYFALGSQIQTLFVVLGFHIIFSIFISASQIEFSANPNYAASGLMGNIIGFATALLFYSIVYKSTMVAGGDKQIYLIMLLPSLLGYVCIPLGAGIREKIYYKFYEMGNNPFYLPSPNEREESAENPQNNIPEEINIEG